jgi:Ca2+-transporting ATPase
MDEARAATISFLAIATAQLWHVFRLRDKGPPPLLNDGARNPYVWGAIGLGAVPLLVAV